MSEEVPTVIESVIAEWREKREAKQEAHQAIVESREYQEQLVRLSHLMFDLVGTFRVC